MTPLVRIWLSVVLLCGSLPALAQGPVPGKNSFLLRGQAQDIYYYPAQGALKPPAPKILFAPGDGGWRGFAVTIAETVAAWGYDVYGVDTKRYLESFTGRTTLQEAEVIGDFGRIGDWVRAGAAERVLLVGWSEGAGLCLLAAAGEDNKRRFGGLVTIGLPEENVLGWRWSDYITYITKKDPKEPKFASRDYMPRVTPLALTMLASTRDEYVPVEAAQRMFAAAQEPKRLVFIEAQNHRFDGNRGEFFGQLRAALLWVREASR